MDAGLGGDLAALKAVSPLTLAKGNLAVRTPLTTDAYGGLPVGPAETVDGRSH